MEFTLSGVLAKITTKPGKADEDGTPEPPMEVLQLEVPVSKASDGMRWFVGREVRIRLMPYQLGPFAVEEETGEARG